MSPGVTSNRNRYMSTRHVSHYLLYGERAKDRKTLRCTRPYTCWSGKCLRSNCCSLGYVTRPSGQRHIVYSPQSRSSVLVIRSDTIASQNLGFAYKCPETRNEVKGNTTA